MEKVTIALYPEFGGNWSCWREFTTVFPDGLLCQSTQPWDSIYRESKPVQLKLTEWPWISSKTTQEGKVSERRHIVYLICVRMLECWQNLSKLTNQRVYQILVYRNDLLGAFHYAKDSGHFGRNSNGKVRFGFFWLEYSGSPLEVVHIFRSEYSDRNSPFHFWQTGSLPFLGNSVTKFKNIDTQGVQELFLCE